MPSRGRKGKADGSGRRRSFPLLLAVALATLATTAAAPANAQQAPTPEATAILTMIDDDARLAIGFAVPLPGVTDKIGLAVMCVRAERSLMAALFFGAFPDDKPVQAAVRDPDGHIARFGPVVRGSRRSGFHDPEVHDRDEILRLMEMAFARGALLSNGHNSVWNRISESDNRGAHRRLLDCAGERG